VGYVASVEMWGWT